MRSSSCGSEEERSNDGVTSATSIRLTVREGTEGERDREGERECEGERESEGESVCDGEAEGEGEGEEAQESESLLSDFCLKAVLSSKIKFNFISRLTLPLPLCISISI